MSFDTHEALKVEIRRLVLPEQEHRYLNDPEYHALVRMLARANVLDQSKRAPERAPKQE